MYEHNLAASNLVPNLDLSIDKVDAIRIALS